MFLLVWTIIYNLDSSLDKLVSTYSSDSVKNESDWARQLFGFLAQSSSSSSDPYVDTNLQERGECHICNITRLSTSVYGLNPKTNIDGYWPLDWL